MLTKLIEIVNRKYRIDTTQDWYKGSKTYFEWLKDEVDEVEIEIKNDNKVYLEDELWDVLYTYLNLLTWLEKEWKIDSIESVITRAEHKFSWRISAIENIDDSLRKDAWDTIKRQQKKENKAEHEKLYF